MIEFIDVCKQDQENQNALSSVNFSLKKGEMAFLTGHSGAGKSTFLKLIAFIERPSSGDILVDGQSLNALKVKDVPYFRRQLGLIFQSPNLLEDRTIFENVSMPLVIQGVPYAEIGRRTRAALELVGLSSKEKFYPQALSGGEQQRIGIARAVVHRPKLLLADEPTGNLDTTTGATVVELLFGLNKEEGTTLVLVTHDNTLADRCQRKFTMTAGHLEEAS